MTRIPQVSGPRLIRALENLGFYVKRQSGGHAIVVHQIDSSRRAVVPIPGNKTVRLGTLRSILDGLQISIDELKSKV